MNQKLKARIVELFGTQGDFAQAVDENESVVSRVIRGRCEIGQVKKEMWAKTLRCRSDQLFPALAKGDNQRAHKVAS
jgi:hypothetical protein